MDVSSSSSSGTAPAQVEAIKKAAEIQEQQVLKVLESATEQTQAASAHKTGLGSHLNVSA